MKYLPIAFFAGAALAATVVDVNSLVDAYTSDLGGLYSSLADYTTLDYSYDYNSAISDYGGYSDYSYDYNSLLSAYGGYSYNTDYFNAIESFYTRSDVLSALSRAETITAEGAYETFALSFYSKYWSELSSIYTMYSYSGIAGLGSLGSFSFDTALLSDILAATLSDTQASVTSEASDATTEATAADSGSGSGSAAPSETAASGSHLTKTLGTTTARLGSSSLASSGSSTASGEGGVIHPVKALGGLVGVVAVLLL